jgi:hypothetical protein
MPMEATGGRAVPWLPDGPNLAEARPGAYTGQPLVCRGEETVTRLLAKVG